MQLGPALGELRIVNRGPATILRSRVAIEQRRGSAFQALAANFELRQSCDAPPPASCTRIDADSTITVVPWTGRLCEAQCRALCRSEGLAPAGTYRFVVTSCDGRTVYDSPPFERMAAVPTLAPASR